MPCSCPFFYQVFGLIEIDEVVRMHLAVGSVAGHHRADLPSGPTPRTRRAGAVDMEVLRSFIIAVPVGVVLAALTAAYISSEGAAGDLCRHHDPGRGASAFQPRELASGRRPAGQSRPLADRRG